MNRPLCLRAGLCPLAGIYTSECKNAWITWAHNQHCGIMSYSSIEISEARPCEVMTTLSMEIATATNRVKVRCLRVNVTSDCTTRYRLYLIRISRLVMEQVSARVQIGVGVAFVDAIET